MSDLDPSALVATMPFAVQSGVEISAASKEAVVGHIDWSEERCTIGGLMHGGALMTLADSLGAVAAFLHLPDGAGTATVTSNTSLLRGLRGGRATGTSTVINAADGSSPCAPTSSTTTASCSSPPPRSRRC